ncbi:MAG: cobalamin-dependent protein [Desulfomonilaceae bacterium]|jgi:methanogenic corrinoid protein MtbC1
MEPITDEIARIIDEQRNAISEAIVSRQYELQPETWKPYGEKGRQLSLRDSNHHLSYLVAALNESDISLFADYVVWVKQLFDGIRIPPEALPTMLELADEILRERLSPEMASITGEYIIAANKQIQHEVGTQSSFITHDAPLHDMAKQYLESLLNGDRRLATILIMEAVDKGESIKDIYLYVFQRSQYEIGRLWHSNRVSVAQEHYCSAATQLIMSQLYSRIFSNEKIGRTLVAACVGGELHEIGVRMVADFFEMEGWDTYYMGANTPASSIIEAIDKRHADVVGISSSTPLHRSALKDLISSIREFDPNKKVKILVGGYTLRTSPELWKRLGADGFAEDAQQAIALANRIVAEKSLS